MTDTSPSMLASSKRDICVDIQVCVQGIKIPLHEQVQQWIGLALENYDKRPVEVSIRIVDKNESQALNTYYRAKHKPTNVLSFRADLPEEIGSPLLGDLAICAELVEQEALEQKKQATDHWAHLVIHGTLHLLGYDHTNEQEAQEMESLEIQLLDQLNIQSPY